MKLSPTPSPSLQHQQVLIVIIPSGKKEVSANEDTNTISAIIFLQIQTIAFCPCQDRTGVNCEPGVQVSNSVSPSPTWKWLSIP